MWADILVERVDAFESAAEYPAAQPILLQVTKEPFHHVEPGRARGREMNVKSGMFSQPFSDLGMVVRCVGVDDEMEGLAGWRSTVD